MNTSSTITTTSAILKRDNEYENRFSSGRLRIDDNLVLDVPHIHIITPGMDKTDRHSYVFTPDQWQNSFARLIAPENKATMDRILAAMPEKDREKAEQGLSDLADIKPHKDHMWVCDYVIDKLTPLLYALHDSERAHNHPQLKPFAESLLIRNRGRQAAMWGLLGLSAVIIGGMIVFHGAPKAAESERPTPAPHKENAPKPPATEERSSKPKLGTAAITNTSFLAFIRGR